MSERGVTESVVEQAALAWFESLGYAVQHGPDIAPDGSTPERASYTDFILDARLRQTLAELNPRLPTEALDDAFRTPGASVVAVKRVDELGFYNLGAKQLAEKVGLTIPKTVAVVEHIDKEFKMGRAVFKRYSQKAVEAIKEALKKESAEDIWTKRRTKARRTSA